MINKFLDIEDIISTPLYMNLCMHLYKAYVKICYGNNTPTSCFLLGMPDTSFNGLRTRSARRVLRSTLSSPRSPLSTENTVRLWYCSLNIVMYLYMLLFVEGRRWTRNIFFGRKRNEWWRKRKTVALDIKIKVIDILPGIITR